MKAILIILALMIGITVQSQTVYVCQFETQGIADNVISQVDTLALAVHNPQPSIIGYSQNLFNSDSTAILESGVFYNVISQVDLPILNQYVIYPCKMKQYWGGNFTYKLKE